MFLNQSQRIRKSLLTSDHRTNHLPPRKMIATFLDGNGALVHQVCHETWSDKERERIEDFIDLKKVSATTTERTREEKTLP